MHFFLGQACLVAIGVRTCASQLEQEFEWIEQMMLEGKLDTQASTLTMVAVRLAEARKPFFNMRPNLVERVPL